MNGDTAFYYCWYSEKQRQLCKDLGDKDLPVYFIRQDGIETTENQYVTVTEVMRLDAERTESAWDDAIYLGIGTYVMGRRTKI